MSCQHQRSHKSMLHITGSEIWLFAPPILRRSSSSDTSDTKQVRPARNHRFWRGEGEVIGNRRMGVVHGSMSEHDLQQLALLRALASGSPVSWNCGGAGASGRDSAACDTAHPTNCTRQLESQALQHPCRRTSCEVVAVRAVRTATPASARRQRKRTSQTTQD